MTPKQPWTRPEATPLTRPGSTSDAPDNRIRNDLVPIGSFVIG